ncbi:MAG: hypothetical protein ACOCO0_08770, partial [Prevotella sp.]
MAKIDNKKLPQKYGTTATMDRDAVRTYRWICKVGGTRYYSKPRSLWLCGGLAHRGVDLSHRQCAVVRRRPGDAQGRNLVHCNYHRTRHHAVSVP